MFIRNRKGILFLVLLLSFSLLITACGGAKKQEVKEEPKDKYADYPNKPISAIAPWSAGGASDIAFRGYVKYIAQELGQDINVQNITGGNGGVGWAAAAAAPADGYNMALLTFDILTNEAQKLTPTTYRDFEIINMFTVQGMMLITHKDFGYKNLDDFIAASKKAKEEGKTLKIGVAGEAGLWHQAGALMAEKIGTEGAYTFVPFKGSADQLADMLGKHLDAMVTSLTASLPHVKEGTLTVLATMTDERIPVISGVPTFKELGYDVKYESWRAVVVPKGTPAPIVEKLREVGKKAYDNPEFLKWANEANIDPYYMDYQKTIKHLEDQYPMVENIMKKFGLIK
ncbi:MAG: tripartite tricarboxylate transporter substrate binding protein [Bacillota bacterium]